MNYSKMRWIALLVGLLPVTTVHLSQLIAISAERIPACFTYIQGCTSISATGRYAPASYVFKGVLFPFAFLLVVYWLRMVKWMVLTEIGRPKSRQAIKLLGVIGALFLTLYVVFLGTDGYTYGLLRRYGVSIFFSFTAVAQILVARDFCRYHGLPLRSQIHRIGFISVCACALMLIGGLTNLFLDTFVIDKHMYRNIIEWNFFLLLAVQPLGNAYLWSQTQVSPGAHNA